jgi:transcriptional regulator with XRE-family HTH domain
MPTATLDIRGYRKAKKWTQTDLAKAAGVALSTIVNAEKPGATPRRSTLAKIEQALDGKRA